MKARQQLDSVDKKMKKKKSDEKKTTSEGEKQTELRISETKKTRSKNKRAQISFFQMATGVTPASIEADCSTLVDSLSTLMRCARVSGAPGADDAKGSSSTSSSSSSMSIAPALVPAVAERLVASAASLAGAAAELRRRAALADVSRRVAAVRSSRRRLSSAAEGVQRELDAIADEVAEAVTVRLHEEKEKKHKEKGGN